MHRSALALGQFAPRGLHALAAAIVIGLAAEGRAIEMFTYFGDGSRIGLPSLEVPVEAYPGIPLRSDRIRARRAARRGVAPVAPMSTQPALPRGITIREMPAVEAPAPQPRLRTPARRVAAPAEMPLPPSPDDILPRDVRPPLSE